MFSIPSISAGGGGPSDANQQSTVSSTVPMAWNSVKNFLNHSDGATQTGSASANPSTGGAGGLGGSIGGIPILYIALGVGAWLILR